MKEKILSQSHLNLIQSKLISRDHKRFFAIARYTGQNIRAICNLKMSDVYCDRHVPMSFINFSGNESKVHFFPIHEPLKNALLVYYPENFLPDGWLFPSRIKKGNHITPNAIDDAFRSALLRTELYHLDISSKMLRESFIYSLYKAGISLDHIKAILGMVSIPEILTRISSEPIDYRHTLEKIFG